MRMRRADHVGMQRADWNGKIVGIAPASRKQRRIFLAQNWLAELLGHRRGSLPYDPAFPTTFVYIRGQSLSAVAR